MGFIGRSELEDSAKVDGRLDQGRPGAAAPAIFSIGEPHALATAGVPEQADLAEIDVTREIDADLHRRWLRARIPTAQLFEVT